MMSLVEFFQVAYIILFMMLFAKIFFFYKNFYCNIKIIIYLMFSLFAGCASTISIFYNITNLKFLKNYYFIIFLMSFVLFQIHIYETITTLIQKDLNSIPNINTDDVAFFQKKLNLYKSLVYTFSSFTSFLITLFIPLFVIKIDKLFNLNLQYLLSTILLLITCIYCFYIMISARSNKQVYIKNFLYVLSLCILLIVQYIKSSEIIAINNLTYISVLSFVLVALCLIVIQLKDCSIFLEPKEDRND